MNNVEETVENVIQILESTDPVIAGTAVTVFYFRDVVTEITKRTLSPSADVVGGLFGKILEHGTFQSQYSRSAATKIGKAVCEVFQKLEDIPPEDFVDSVPPELAVPIFNKLTYFEDHELRDLLTSLLASSMLKSEQVHPAVVSLVDRLTAGEAKILKFYADANQFGPWPCITVLAATTKRNDSFVIPNKTDLAALRSQQSISDTYKKLFDKSGQSGFFDIGAQFLGTMGFSKAFKGHDEALFYVTNLRALGLIEVTAGYIKNEKEYINLVYDAYDFIEQARKQSSHEPILELSKLSITTLGLKTMDAFKKC